MAWRKLKQRALILSPNGELIIYIWDEIAVNTLKKIEAKSPVPRRKDHMFVKEKFMVIIDPKTAHIITI